MTSRDVITTSRDVITSYPSSRDYLFPTTSSSRVNKSPVHDDLNGFTISLVSDPDVHPLQIKRKLKQRRHSMYTSLSDFTSQGFVPFLPEGLMKKDTTPKHLIRRSSTSASNSSSASNHSSPSNNSPERVRRKRFSDADIDQLSFLYSNNFDPSKSPPSKKEEGNDGNRLRVLREEEGEGIKSSRSDSDLLSRKGRRYSTVN